MLTVQQMKIVLIFKMVDNVNVTMDTKKMKLISVKVCFFYITFKYLNVRTLFVTIKLNYKVISTITGETYIKTKNSKENKHEI